MVRDRNVGCQPESELISDSVLDSLARMRPTTWMIVSLGSESKLVSKLGLMNLFSKVGGR